jgi:hypothetical protein
LGSIVRYGRNQGNQRLSYRANQIADV